jgi:hypothetical protein
VPLFSFYIVPESGEPSMRVVEAQSLDAARALAMGTIKRETLRAIHLWDGHRMSKMQRPSPQAVRVLSRSKAHNGSDERGQRMIAMRAKGKTYREVATAFGVSVDRVRQLITRAEHYAKIVATQPNRAALSTRAWVVLTTLIGHAETDPIEYDRLLPERAAMLGRTRVLKAHNAGKGTLAEIEAWLWERGLCFAEGD